MNVAIQLIIQMCTSLLRWRLNLALQFSQGSSSRCFSWSGHFRHSFVKGVFRDTPTNFCWNGFIFDRQRAKNKLAQFFETRCTLIFRRRKLILVQLHTSAGSEVKSAESNRATASNAVEHRHVCIVSRRVACVACVITEREFTAEFSRLLDVSFISRNRDLLLVNCLISDVVWEAMDEEEAVDSVHGKLMQVGFLCSTLLQCLLQTSSPILLGLQFVKYEVRQLVTCDLRQSSCFVVDVVD